MGIIQNAINRTMGSISLATGIINKQTQAMRKVQEKRESQKTQKRNFNSYISNIKTSYGVKLGDLGPKAVKAVAAQYTPYQRKKLMDTMDKEKK